MNGTKKTGLASLMYKHYSLCLLLPMSYCHCLLLFTNITKLSMLLLLSLLYYYLLLLLSIIVVIIPVIIIIITSYY